MKIKHLLLVALFTSLTAIMAQIQIRIPFSPVPVTFQVLAVCLCSTLLGKKYSAISQVIYILIGIMGFPVFSGFNSGLGALAGPTGGYIMSFPLSAYLIGFIIEKYTGNPKHPKLLYFAAMSAGLLLTYLFGTVWMAFILGLTAEKALIMGIGWYLPLDIAKLIIAVHLSVEIKKLLIKSNLM